MEDTIEAYEALHNDWPLAIVSLLDPVFWGEVPLRSEKEIVCHLRALNKSAHERAEAVAGFIKRGLSTDRIGNLRLAMHLTPSR